jgi:CheY-like chemotaxis protein
MSDVAGYQLDVPKGYTVRVNKPLVGRKLLSALKLTMPDYLSAAAPKLRRARPVMVSSAPKREMKRVLLAESHAASRQVMSTFFRGRNVQLHSVENGEQAVESAKAVDFDVIFMNVQLSKLDGFLATRAIRGYEKNEKSIHTPIICMSRHAIGADEDLAKAVGMDDFLVQPLSTQKLEDVMTKWSGIKAGIRDVKAAQARRKDPMVQPLKRPMLKAG